LVKALGKVIHIARAAVAHADEYNTLQHRDKVLVAGAMEVGETQTVCETI
jgi:hypothetical protein